jgi:hemerythrin
MAHIEKIKIISGVYWIAIKEADFYCLCGCPEDIVKHLIKKGLIKNIEKNGRIFQSGPNAILLSDILVQKGRFSNLAEFPVLQMLYMQGMALPNHPNNTGMKPILIGEEKQVNAQMEYIYRGNYGLISKEEIMEVGIDEEAAEEMMRLKLKFAFGNIRKTEELLDSKIVKHEQVEIRNGISIKRNNFNRYEFSYKGESVEVNLTLALDKEYEPAYELGFYQVKPEYFSVIHSGDGDGWDINRPCMSSVLVFQEKIYLIDAGPNILTSLTALGIGVNEIEGIFQTHGHDDHFAGLPTLLRADHRIKFYSTPLVRASVTKKLSALFNWGQDHLENYFEICDLELDVWNNVEGLEVKPTLSPHPVETNIYTFRTLWEKGYCTYAHLADIAALDVLKGMITTDETEPGIPQSYYEQIKGEYLEPADIKKIDVGGGLIHGVAEDFFEDVSKKIVLSHKAEKLTVQEKEIGSSAPFGMVDVLISSNQDYTMRIAAQLMRDYFPEAPAEDLRMMLNFQVESFNAGTILIKGGETTPFIYLILTGMVETIHSKTGRQRMISTGSLVGELSGLMNCSSMETVRAESYIRTLKIPGNFYNKFIKRNKLYQNYHTTIDNREFLQNTWLFGEMVSYPILNKISKQFEIAQYPMGKKRLIGGKPELILLKEGELEIYSKGELIDAIEPGEFYGEDSIVGNKSETLEIQAAKQSTVYEIEGSILMDIPIVLWKLLEISERRYKIKNV